MTREEYIRELINKCDTAMLGAVLSNACGDAPCCLCAEDPEWCEIERDIPETGYIQGTNTRKCCAVCSRVWLSQDADEVDMKEIKDILFNGFISDDYKKHLREREA